LLANGAYLWPGNVSHEDEYRATAQEDDYPTGRLGTTTIEDCRGVYTEACALDHYHARVGSVRFDDPGQFDGDVLNESEQLPKFVLLDDGYYRRTATMDDETLVLSMEPVSRAHVYRVAGENVSEVDPVFRRAVEIGAATTDEHLYDRRYWSLTVTCPTSSRRAVPTAAT
jgi:hypothetical protein